MIGGVSEGWTACSDHSALTVGSKQSITCRVEEAAIRDVGKALLLRRQRVHLVDLEAVGIVDSLAGADRVVLRT
eukprot:COSAG04_NODE_2255_length_4440_cov_25.402952_8_plen_74_part_00